MANCVLCGKKVGLLDQIELDFHGSKQILCSACDVRMSKASPGERQDLEQEILVSPYLQKADTVQANVNTGKSALPAAPCWNASWRTSPLVRMAAVG